MALSGSLTFIYAVDFEASLAFYGTTLGLPVAGTMGDDVRVFALPGAYLAIVKQGYVAARTSSPLPPPPPLPPPLPPPPPLRPPAYLPAPASYVGAFRGGWITSF